MDLPTQQTNQSSMPFSGSSNKEVDGGAFLTQEKVLIGEGRSEPDVPKEVMSAGVQVQATTIPLPQSVAAIGVQSVGYNINPLQMNVTLPLTDDQIVLGLHQGMRSSWRWLAQWCERRLKQVHISLKTIHGKLMRISK